MNRIITAVLLAIIACPCWAQTNPQVQTDTLIVKSVKYNLMEVQHENWPCTEIYRDADSFTIGDQTLEIVSMEQSGKVRYGSREVIFNLDEGKKLSFYENPVQKVIVFEGYEIVCQGQVTKDKVKTKARHILQAADSLAQKTERKVREAMR